MYTKLFSKILDSSIWLESTATRIVWITLLAAKDRDQIAHFAAVGNLARRAGVSVEEAEEAIRVLESPDIHNPDQEHEGRRIERVDGGWFIVKGAMYDGIRHAEELREQSRIRVNRYRQRKKGDVTACNASNALQTQTETETTTPPVVPQGGPVFPESLDTPEFRAKWGEWVQHRTELKKKLTPLSVAKQLKHLERLGPGAIPALDNAIEKGWSFPYAPKESFAPKNSEDTELDDWNARMDKFFQKPGVEFNKVYDFDGKLIWDNGKVVS